MSTSRRPKQFHELQSGITLVQATAKRFVEALSADMQVNKPLYLTSRAYSQYFSEDDCVLYEDYPRDTAAAIAIATHWCVDNCDPDTLMLIVPSDHDIGNFDAFSRDIRRGINACINSPSSLVLFGLKPYGRDEEELLDKSTKFGHIYFDNGVIKFLEKPTRERVKYYLDKGSLWNSGIFLMRSVELSQMFQRIAPDIWNLAGNSECPKSSFDITIVQNLTNILLVDCGYWDWDDVGTWSSWFSRSKETQNRSCTVQDQKTINYECSNTSIINLTDKRVVTIGCDGLIVVATDNGVLVIREGRDDLLKRAVSIYGLD